MLFIHSSSSIYPFIYLSTLSSTCLFIHLPFPIHSSIKPFINSFIKFDPSIHPFIHPVIHLFIHSLIHSLNFISYHPPIHLPSYYSFIHPAIIYPSIHPPSHPFIHPFTHSFIEFHQLSSSTYSFTKLLFVHPSSNHLFIYITVHSLLYLISI